MLKRYLHFISSRLLAFLSTFIPKDKKMIMFISRPDFSDNPRYLFDAIITDKSFKDYYLIWVVSDKSRFSLLEKKWSNVLFVEYRTFEYFFKLLRSKYLILSHGIPYWKSRNQIAILLWHGIPLKAMGKFLSSIKISWISQWMLNKTDYLIFPSKFSYVIFSADTMISPRYVLYLGQPRCDALFSGRERAVERLGELSGKAIRDYNKIIMYLPTFRDYDTGATRKIASDLLTNEDFKKFLSRNNILFIIKPHPRDEGYFEKLGSDNIVVLKNSDLLGRFLTLYDILPAVDVLVTDYSSVYFDYLLLNRPIVFYVPDLEKYKEIRGFLLEPYERWTPGDKARTITELIQALQEAIDNPNKWKEKREWLRDVMFKYQDGKASERIIRYFWGNV